MAERGHSLIRGGPLPYLGKCTFLNKFRLLLFLLCLTLCSLFNSLFETTKSLNPVSICNTSTQLENHWWERTIYLPNTIDLNCEYRWCGTIKYTDFEIRLTWIKILGLQFTGTVTRDKWFNLAVTPFPQPQYVKVIISLRVGVKILGNRACKVFIQVQMLNKSYSELLWSLIKAVLCLRWHK